MTVKRIVPDIAAASVPEVSRFYAELLGLEVVMDLGWIVTLAADRTGPLQINIGSEGGSGTPMPDMSIEVDDVDAVYAKAQSMGCDIAYELTDEPWPVRRFFVRDPAGKLVNILSHR